MAWAACVAIASGETAEEKIDRLERSNEALRKFALDGLVGRRYEEIKTKDGTVYPEPVVVDVSGRVVRIRYEEDGRESTASIDLGNGPAEWSVLLPPGEASEAVVVRGEATKPGQKVAKAIVVIEGDQGVGTGFLAESEGKVYLYTAAHVLSGNTRLAVKLQNGRKITSFGKFEASDGADLVRLEVTEEVDSPLKVASSSGRAREDMVVFAAGNAGGGGTVGFERGKIVGVGAESIEIDADVIQGNSGGPILDGVTHEVLGVVTHLIAARLDHWAKETRYSDVRRFGCRLDRKWGWQDIAIGRFLGEGQKLKEVTDLNELFIIAMQPSEWESSRLSDFKGHIVEKEIRALQDWIDDKSGSGTGVSEADRKRKVAALFTGIQSSSRAQLRAFKPDRYVWFHREMAEQAMKLREELDKACNEAVDDLR
ncbi:serine protease protein [Haloferula helveola]|uniref:Serine protease protein n=2 Tax=Haloferula helveola TaxID=490095 RepID=A0ABM7RDW9_9BACT|nr:serine protease protein [Haloferula helveola]